MGLARRHVLLLSPLLGLPLLALSPPAPAAAQEGGGRDRVVLASGVTLEGVIGSLQQGYLVFTTEELDELEIEVLDVARLVSARRFELIMDDGRILDGRLEAADADGSVRVAGAPGDPVISLDQVTEMLAWSNRFWGRTQGFVDVGAEVAQANSRSSLALSGRLLFDGPRWRWELAGDEYWQRQVVVSETDGRVEAGSTRTSLETTLSRHFGAWAVRTTAEWGRNDQLSLENRFQAGLQAVFTLEEEDRVQLEAAGGLVTNTEEYTLRPYRSTVEATVGGELEVTVLGQVDVSGAATLFRSLTEAGRYRGELDARLQWELSEGFFLAFRVTESLDTRPPVSGGRRRDYRYGLSVGLSWD